MKLNKKGFFDILTLLYIYLGIALVLSISRIYYLVIRPESGVSILSKVVTSLGLFGKSLIWGIEIIQVLLRF